MSIPSIPKPWGREDILYREKLESHLPWSWPFDNLKQVKMLFIQKGEGTSLQFHWNKEEYFMVGKGKVSLTLGNQIFLVLPGMFVYVPPAALHQIQALEESELIEVSRGNDLDIVRVKDKYQRAKG